MSWAYCNIYPSDSYRTSSFSRPCDQAEYFLSLGLDVNSVDNKGKSAIYLTIDDLNASRSNRWAHYPYNIVNKAIKRADTLISVLIERGADVNLANHEGMSPIHLLYEYEHVEMLEFLVSKGTDINWKNRKGCSLAHMLCNFLSKPREKFIKTAIQLGLDIELLDNEGKAALDCCHSDDHRKQMIKIFNSYSN